MFKNKVFLVAVFILPLAAYFGGKMLEGSKRNANYVILTGGPGGGKSSVLEALRKKGFACVEEVARDLIKNELAAGGSALPWDDAESFRDKMFDEQLKVYNSTQNDGVVFFDRGLIDCLAYSRLIGVEVPEEMKRLSQEYSFNPVVFVTPPWEEIYRNDAERKQSFQEAVDTYEQIVATYREYGYEAVDLPKASIDVRVAFILKNLGLQ